MKNKFLEKYPSLWAPKVGDKVRIINLLGYDLTNHGLSSPPYVKIGTKCVILNYSNNYKLWRGKFQIDKRMYDYGYNGETAIGFPGQHFVLDNE